MRKIVYLLLALTTFAFAQQEQQYSQYMINQFALNPAVAGTEDFIDLNLGIRQQWLGFEGAPLTYYASGHATLGKPVHQYHHSNEQHNWHGVGFQLVQDQTGPIARKSILFAYAYNFVISRNVRASFGAYAGAKQLSVDAGYWKNIDDPSDRFFNTDLNTDLQPDIHMGGLVYSKKFFVGLSLFQLLNQKMSYGSFWDEVGQNGKLKTHLYGNAGVKLWLNDHVEIMPCIMFKYVDSAPLSIDLNAKVTVSEKYWYGASYRALESFNVFAGLEIHRSFDVSYAFEWSTSKIGRYIAGTHELIVGVRLRHPKNIECPSRYW